MTAADIASHIPDARPVAGGQRAPGTCHGSRSLSLSLRDGYDGRILLKCFAGCELQDITQALGIRVADLFPPSDRTFRSRPARRATPEDVRAELERESARYCIEHRIDDAERLVHADITEVRHRVSARLGVTLPPVTRHASDSHAGGHERDPLWPTLLDRAWVLEWLDYDGRLACCPVDDFAAHGAIGIKLLERAERSAAAELRAMPRRSA